MEGLDQKTKWYGPGRRRGSANGDRSFVPMVLPTTLVRFSGKLVNAFDDAPLHNGLKTVDLSLIHLSPCDRCYNPKRCCHRGWLRRRICPWGSPQMSPASGLLEMASLLPGSRRRIFDRCGSPKLCSLLGLPHKQTRPSNRPPVTWGCQRWGMVTL